MKSTALACASSGKTEFISNIIVRYRTLEDYMNDVHDVSNKRGIVPDEEGYAACPYGVSVIMQDYVYKQNTKGKDNEEQ